MTKTFFTLIIILFSSQVCNAKIVGILAERFLINRDVCDSCGFDKTDSYILDSDILNAVKFSCEKNGIMVVVLSNQDSSAMEYAKNIDGLVIPDYKIPVNAKLYGQHSILSESILIQNTSQHEIQIVRSFVDAKKPILGINRGMQVLNIAHSGGTLMQEIPKNFGKHELDRDEKHLINVEKNTILSKIFQIEKQGEAMVNSSHSQAIDVIGKGLIVTAKSEHGLIEAIESEDKNFELGIQWNPESLNSIEDVHIFDAFCKAVAKGEKMNEQ